MKVYCGRSSDIIKEITEDRVDFGIFYNRPASRAFESLQVSKIHFSVVTSTANPIGNWRTFPFIGPKVTQSDHSFVSLSLLKSIGVIPERIHEVNNQESQKQIVLKGLGYTVVPHFMVEKEIAENRLHEIVLAEPLKAPLYLVQKKGKKLSGAETEFRKSFLEAGLR